MTNKNNLKVAHKFLNYSFLETVSIKKKIALPCLKQNNLVIKQIKDNHFVFTYK